MTPATDKTPSNTQRAVTALRHMIFSGALPAGSDHLESELAEQLGMSRTPVREAALTLEAQGLLALRPRKGIRILPISPDDMREIYEVLTELESLAARQAAEASLTDTDLRPLGQAIADMDTALENNALEVWAEADDRFHRALVTLGGNTRVVAIFDLMSDQVRRARAVTLYMRPLPLQSNADHRRVYDAIRAGDAAQAAATHRAHRQAAKAMILDLLQRYKLRQI